MKAILKNNEIETELIKHNVKYEFDYDSEDNFFININNELFEEVSTAFDFVD